MPWPPREGELLPRFGEAIGIEEKLREYALKPSHKDGSPKANGFLTMLGIDLASIEYLEQEIRIGITRDPIAEVRSDEPDVHRCVVELHIAGIGRYSQRRAWVRTVWQLDGPGSAPRFITAIPRGRRKR